MGLVSTPVANWRGWPTTAQMPPFGKAAASRRFITTVPTASRPSESLRFDSKYMARPRQSRSWSLTAMGLAARPGPPREPVVVGELQAPRPIVVISRTP